MSFLIALDPGKKGGVAFGVRGGSPSARKLPETPEETAALFREILEKSPKDEVTFVLEQVGGYVGGGGQPGSAMFTFGKHYGMVLGILAVLGIKPMLVTPQVWQKKLDIGTRGLLSKPQWKNKLKELATSLYPKTKPTLQTADALLIWHTAQ